MESITDSDALIRSKRQSPTRHKLICDICKLVETKLSTQEILDRTPIDYGDVVTYDHLNYLFDRTYDRLAKFSYASLIIIHLIWLLKTDKCY